MAILFGPPSADQLESLWKGFGDTLGHLRKHLRSSGDHFGAAWEPFWEPWGGPGELIAGLLAPHGLEEGPHEPPSGSKDAAEVPSRSPRGLKKSSK